MVQRREFSIQLKQGGVAPIISYNVPEPTSYSGRNYIDLQIDRGLFKTDPGLEPNGTLPAAQNPQARKVQTETIAVKTVQADSYLAAAIDIVDSEDVPIAVSKTSLPAIEDEPTFAPTSPVLLRRPIEDGGGGGGPNPDPKPDLVYLTIDSHSNGALIRGAHTGAQVTLSGTVGADRGVRKVDVNIGSAATQSATTNGANWSFSTAFTNPGSAIVIRVTATSMSGRTATKSITVNIALDPAPDTVDPLLTIQQPADGTTIVQSANGASVLVQGTASDVGSGVKSVQVSVNQGNWTQATAVTPNFAMWNHPLTLTQPGSYRIAVRCLDHADRVTTRTVQVAIAPRDTTKPILTIASPRPGTQITGPFEGVTVNLEGTASDESAIAKIEVFVNGNPAAIPAQPRAGNTLNQWVAPITFNNRGPNSVRVVCTDVHNNAIEQTIEYTVELIPKVTSRLTRLILVENYRLSSFLGNYGVGRTLKTFSLLPGEKTKLSIKTFTRSEEDRKATSSILDSYTDQTQDSFEKSMEAEQTNRKAYQETEAYTVSAEAKASWGWGSAGISASASVGTNAAREEFAKNISAATQKHVSEASAKRDVQINTSYEVKTSVGEDTAVEREIQNVNMSRTLNFVFRQMNQEYITLLHLLDVRIGYFKVIEEQGKPTDTYIYREVTLPQLYPLLQTVLNPYNGTDVNGKPDPDRYVREIYNQILFQVMNMYDYKDFHHSFAEWRELKGADGKPQDRYLRVKKDYTSLYHDEATGTQIRVPGIIMAANKYVLRTEGIIVEALLGQGDALDDYSHGLQDEAVRERRIANDRDLAEVQRLRLANRILEDKDEESIRLYKMMYDGAAAQEPASEPLTFSGAL